MEEDQPRSRRKGKRATDWIGRVFGNMTVLCCVTAPHGSDAGHWLVRCDTCGAVNTLSGTSLGRRAKYPHTYKTCCEIARYGRPRRKKG